MSRWKNVYFNVCMELKTPSEEGKKFSFKSRMEDIIYAVKSFNGHYKDSKEIKLVDVTDINEVILLLKIKVLDNVILKDINARELSYFSKRLYHDKGWGKYSRVPSKLFTATMFDLLEDEEATPYDSLPIIPKEFDGIENKVSEVDFEIDSRVLTDEEAIDVLRALFAVKDIGSSEMTKKRNENIEKIKELLVESF